MALGPDTAHTGGSTAHGQRKERYFTARSRWSLDTRDESHSPRQTVAAVKGRLKGCACIQITDHSPRHSRNIEKEDNL